MYPKRLLPKKLLKHIHKEESEMETVVAARTRPKYIGGVRAVYDEMLL